MSEPCTSCGRDCDCRGSGWVRDCDVCRTMTKHERKVQERCPACGSTYAVVVYPYQRGMTLRSE